MKLSHKTNVIISILSLNADTGECQPQQLWSYRLSGNQPWATDHSLSPLHGHGTVCRQPYRLHRRAPPSDENWKHFFFTRVFRTTSRQFTVSSYFWCRYLIDCVKCPCSVLRASLQNRLAPDSVHCGSVMVKYH